MLQAAVDRHSAQQPTRVSLALRPIWSELSPESKIVFLSQESSADIMEEALSTGASGYVVKAKGAAQLLATLDAVILQRRFFTTS
jgi:DNA-binding NarL/FixJ family response regulator